MLPEAFADNAAFALLYALGVIAASCTIAFLANLILGQVLNLLVKRHESPLRSIEIRIIGALRFPAALVIILIGTRLALTSLSQASTQSLGFISNLDQLGHTTWLVAVAALVCYAISRLIRALMRWYSAPGPPRHPHRAQHRHLAHPHPNIVHIRLCPGHARRTRHSRHPDYPAARRSGHRRLGSRPCSQPHHSPASSQAPMSSPRATSVKATMSKSMQRGQASSRASDGAAQSFVAGSTT